MRVYDVHTQCTCVYMYAGVGGMLYKCRTY